MHRWVLILLAACQADGKSGNGHGEDSSTSLPSTGLATGAGTATGAVTGSGTGAVTGAATGMGTGSSTGTATGAGTGTGTGGTTMTGTGTGTYANCNIPIPNNAVVIDTTQGSGLTNTTFWVCPHATLSFFGSNSTLFIDVQGEAVLSGTNNTLYVVDRGDVALFSGSNTVIWETGAVIDDQPVTGTNVQIQCLDLMFDLANAPVPGC